MNKLSQIIGIIAALSGLFAYAAFYYKSKIFGTPTWHVEVNEKLIALTFDDGPNPPYTLQIAEIIEHYNGHATFFVVGKNCEKYPDLANKLVQKGHEIGIHSYAHKFSKYFTDPLFKTEIGNSKAVLNKQGISVLLFRFPWLFRTPWLMKSVKKQGLSPIFGQFAHILEPFQINSKKISNRVLKNAKPGSIIIFHDGYDAKSGNRQQTVKAVETVCKQLSEQGFGFVTVSELLNKQQDKVK